MTSRQQLAAWAAMVLCAACGGSGTSSALSPSPSLAPSPSQAQGSVDVKTTVPATYPPANGTWYVVLHSGPDMQGSSASYLLCGNLFA